MRKRATLFEDYYSIGRLLKLGPNKLRKRIFSTFNRDLKTFYYTTFILVTAFLLLTAATFKPSLKKFESCVLAIFIMTFCIRSMPKIFFISSAILICGLSAAVIRKENKKLSNIFLLITGILSVEFIFIGATIQIGIPKRAKFQFSILSVTILMINAFYFFEAFTNRHRLIKTAKILCCSAGILSITAVSTECFNMRCKWERMEKSIACQKSEGAEDIVIDINTFRSKYPNYGDWINPDENLDTWPNTSYAQYYKVKSITAQEQ